MARTPRSFEERRAAAAARRDRRAAVEDAAVVMDAAAAFLAVRPRSIAETRRRLRHLGYPGALSDEVIDRLIELGYLDDEAFARAWVESRDRARPRGAAALRRELELKGVEREVIDTVLQGRVAAGLAAAGASDATSADVEREAATRLLERRRSSIWREPDVRRRRQKAYALLARNGFTPGVCQDVATSFTLEREDGAGTDV